LTYRASSSPAGRKICWWPKRALARKKSVAPPDVGRGSTEGETVRVREDKPTVFFTSGPQVSKLEGSGHDRRRSRAFARPALTGGVKQSPLTRRSTPFIIKTARSGFRRTAYRTDSDSDSGVPAGDEENVRDRRDSVKAPQGPRRSTGSPHPRC